MTQSQVMWSACYFIVRLYTRLNSPDRGDFERRWEQEGKTGSEAPVCWFQILLQCETQLWGGQTDSTRAFTASGVRTGRFWIKPKPLKPQRISADTEMIWKERRDCCGESGQLIRSEFMWSACYSVLNVLFLSVKSQKSGIIQIGLG